MQQVQVVMTFATQQEAAEYLMGNVPVGANPSVQTSTSPAGTHPVLAALNDSRYALRSADSLMEAGDFYSIEDLYYFLEERGVGYLTKQRRSDGATLIGLRSRN